jgi:hypothetical protein
MRIGFFIGIFLALVPAFLVPAQNAAADEYRIADKVHLGVASCASSVCHGKLDRQAGQNVWLNEYRIWTGAGKHSLAYRLLENEASRRIANNLGLASATTAKVCLDCHADNVPPEKRGPKFQIRDGVGCEACHGGAEEWIESHAAEGATHEANLQAGMFPSESPVERAALCLSCHMGNAEKYAGHDIMGAGHPRLSFELEAFQTNQPAHFDVDDDYRSRKGEIPGFNLWLSGQVESGIRFAELVANRISGGAAPYPELALYDCHACHHEMDDRRWTPGRSAGTGPGALRLQDQHLLILQSALGALESAAASDELGAMAAALVRGGQEDITVAAEAAGRISAWLQARQQAWADRQFTADEVRAVRRAIANDAARGRMGDFNAAEQAVLALESLSYSLRDWDRVSAAMDSIFNEVADDADFSPTSFAGTAGRIAGQF